MAQPVVDSLTRVLVDPEQYVFLPEREIFDEHVEEDEEPVRTPDGKPRVDAEGRPVTRKVVRRFDRARLQLICDRSNARDRMGALAPLTLGHTIPGEDVPEGEQPEPVGYARNFKVRYNEQDGRHVITADFYVKKDRWAEASTFPRTSIELWPSQLIVDPVALIRRTPDRDLPQWTYTRSALGRDVIRYAKEFHAMPDVPPAPPAPAATAPDELSHEDKVEHFVRHMMSHPHALHLARHYAMADGGEVAPHSHPVGPPMEEPEEPLRHMEEDGEVEPDRHAAFTSATNPVLPSGAISKGKDIQRHSRNGDAIQYARMRRELDELKASMKVRDQELRQYARQAAEADCRARVQRLAGLEGYELDEDAEVERMIPLDAAARDKHEEHIRRYYKQAPVAPYPHVPVLIPPVSKNDPENLTPDRLKEVLRYQREHRIADFDEAVKKYHGRN